jgi:hypothetical protein
MLAALPQPLRIEQVGDTVLEGLLGPALIALAAISAAFVAAWVARRNHEQQLRHDRELRDLDHARQSINSAVETVAEGVDAMSKLSVASEAASEARQRVEEAESKTATLGHLHYDEDGDLVDARNAAEIDATPPATYRKENDIVEAEVDAHRAELEAIEKAMAARKPAGSILTQMLADTLRLRISIGVSSKVVERYQGSGAVYRGDECF